MNKEIYDKSEDLKKIIWIYKDLCEFWKFDLNYENKQIEKMEKLISSIYKATNFKVDFIDEKITNLICKNKYKFTGGLPLLEDKQIKQMIKIIKPESYDDLEYLIKQLHSQNYKIYTKLAIELAYYKLNFPMEFYCCFLNLNITFIKNKYVLSKIDNKYIVNKNDTEFILFYESNNKNIPVIYSIDKVFEELNTRAIQVIYNQNENNKRFKISGKNISLPMVLLDNKVVKLKEAKIFNYKLKEVK